ncbi:MAG TPA: F0F1 ATP synthase subunit beta, partial [Coxiellaceae bacterium]|nr:F0F1 ATP synthase subunit beta [Coxiellaceae bacterium]
MSDGHIIEIIGAVVDIEFPRGGVPNIYDALYLAEKDLTFEVQQQMGDGVVRTIAMGPTEGLKRGLTIKNTGAPITIPVGEKTLGRIMNVLGQPIDKAGPIDTKEYLPIHRKAPAFVDQASTTAVL